MSLHITTTAEDMPPIMGVWKGLCLSGERRPRSEVHLFALEKSRDPFPDSTSDSREAVSGLGDLG